MNDASFDRSVFINCPFDEEFAPILQAIAFCITYLGYCPRLAPENPNNARSRLDRIYDIICSSRFSIHDLSRCQAVSPGDYGRFNMPFELGLDHGCARFGDGDKARKSILILERKRFDSQKCLSDISGWDIHSHDDDHIKAVRCVSNWIHQQTGGAAIPASQILGKYGDFQSWYWDSEKAKGASEDDIKYYPTIYFIKSMQRWMQAGQPL